MVIPKTLADRRRASAEGRKRLEERIRDEEEEARCEDEKQRAILDAHIDNMIVLMRQPRVDSVVSAVLYLLERQKEA